MKKLLLSIMAVATLFSARADEGMWLPYLIGKNYEEMVRMGLKLSKDDLYSINNSSLKDAIVQFGGGCTAEVISPSGLLLTNHHCGYGNIAGLSTVQNNYLENGFWAMSHAQELPAPGLSVIFLERMEDVTEEINKATRRLKGDKLTKKLDAIRKEIETRESQNGKYVTSVKEFFNGNQQILLVYKRYTDVRLVGTPPRSLGKYGGDTDNWMWPRHTADFSIFRIYAGPDNEPAAYSANNVPLRPKKFLPVSAKGVKEGDFAMIFGYPGRTNRYEIASGLNMAIEDVNPSIVKLREERLAIMRRNMQADPAVNLKLTSQYASISNYWKYFIGQTEQLKRRNVVARKQQEEAAFIKWAGKGEYKNLLRDYEQAYAEYRPYAKHVTYYSEGFRAPALARLAAALEPLDKMLKPDTTVHQDTIKKYVNQLRAGRKAVLGGAFDLATDREILAKTAEMFYNDVPRAQHPDVYQRVIFSKFGSATEPGTFSEYASHMYANTFLLDSARFEAFAANPTRAQIEADPAAQYAISFVRNFNQYYMPKYEAFNKRKAELSKSYVRGLMEMNGSERMFYPDANSTMRISYGQVKSYSPQDAVHYNYFTTMEGLMDKYKPGDHEFDLPAEFIELVKKKDYGRYMSADSTLHINFITTNDITGGNSGSPIINGNGELIGIAFDGNWEAMSGDIAFDKEFKRTIAVDARFMLFIIEKLGGARNLIEEMEIHY